VNLQPKIVCGRFQVVNLRPKIVRKKYQVVNLQPEIAGNFLHRTGTNHHQHTIFFKMKASIYKKIRPADVFTSTLGNSDNTMQQAKSTANWIELRPTGNNFIDLFAQLVREHGNLPAKTYAGLMGLELRLFTPAIVAMTGLGPREWICEYLHMASCELLEKTGLSIGQAGKCIGFPSASAFSQFFLRVQKCQPYEWRNRQKTGQGWTYHR
jgi:AraC-like DNA-binding protein